MSGIEFDFDGVSPFSDRFREMLERMGYYIARLAPNIEAIERVVNTPITPPKRHAEVRIFPGMITARTITPAPTGGAAINATYDAIFCGGDPKTPIIEDQQPLARDFGDTQFTPADVDSPCLIIKYTCGNEIEYLLWQAQEKLIYDNCAPGFAEDSGSFASASGGEQSAMQAEGYSAAEELDYLYVK